MELPGARRASETCGSLSLRRGELPLAQARGGGLSLMRRSVLAPLTPERDTSNANSEKAKRTFGRPMRCGGACLPGLDRFPRIRPGEVHHGEGEVSVLPAHTNARPAILKARAVIETKTNEVGAPLFPGPFFLA